jgi:hypothetical protein
VTWLWVEGLVKVGQDMEGPQILRNWGILVGDNVEVDCNFSVSLNFWLVKLFWKDNG